MKWSHKKAQAAAMAIMVLIMTFVVVFVSTLINFGLDDLFFLRSIRGWGIAFVLAFPLVIFLMPRINKIFQSFVRKD